jgi:sugar phosphate isomerase/epimerase
LADTYHMNIEEVDMAASLRRAGARLGHIHLVDSNRQAPGHGHCDLSGLVQTLCDVGYQGHLSFEVVPLPSPQQAAEDSICTVRGYPALRAQHA